MTTFSVRETNERKPKISSLSNPNFDIFFEEWGVVSGGGGGSELLFLWLLLFLLLLITVFSVRGLWKFCPVPYK